MTYESESLHQLENQDVEKYEIINSTILLNYGVLNVFSSGTEQHIQKKT